MFENFLNPIFAPLLKIPVFWSLLIIALLVAVIITLVYKWMTDQHLMKSLKEEIKEFQKKMKELKHDPQEVMKVQKRAMETNMKYMMHSMKPTLITFIPIIIIFGWLNAHLAYDPIMPGQEFTTTALFEKNTFGEISLTVPEGLELISNGTQEIVDSQAVWALKGDAGSYLLEYEFNGESHTKDLLITEERDYAKPVETVKNSKLRQLKIDMQKIKPIPGIPLGWLGTYIILSIVFSMTLRKILKLH